jgi:hypothetical protein
MTLDQLTAQLTHLPGLVWLIVGGFAAMLIMIWGAFVNYFALKEASGMTTERAVPVYILGAIVAEVISKVVIILGAKMM